MVYCLPVQWLEDFDEEKTLKLLKAFTVGKFVVVSVLRLIKLPRPRLALANHASAKGGC